jgi:hypothetical protein
LRVNTEEIKSEVQEKVKDKCFIDEKWFDDYKRIRIVAIKRKKICYHLIK